MERIYFSINKFISYVNENKPFEQSLRGRIENPYTDPKTISLWFETNETFTNKFKQVVIKPIAITLRNPEKSITLTHQTIIDAFNNKQPYISFNENKNKTVPKTKNGELSFLLIEMTQMEFKGTSSPGSKSQQKKYYPSRTGLTTNKEVVKNILEKKLNEETEEGDYGFECTEFI